MRKPFPAAPRGVWILLLALALFAGCGREQASSPSGAEVSGDIQPTPRQSITASPALTPPASETAVPSREASPALPAGATAEGASPGTAAATGTTAAPGDFQQALAAHWPILLHFYSPT